eukprot:XP_011602701.1 PREDICTED: lung adenoma susceptibility protein 2 isoform X2 [Takifugu rubripes]
MESSSLDGAFLSPESTVTSLLSSSGHLRSCLEVPEHNTTFRYKYKLYDSASAALNAYIADFNNSHLKEKLLTGNLNASHHFPSTASRPRVARLKNHDVLREHLTDRELDFLRLPDNSHLQSVNQDRVSMTTDELLSIPYDGSMPVTHTSAFIQGLFSQLLDSQPSASSRPANRSWNRSHSMPTVPELSQQHASPTRSFRKTKSIVCLPRSRRPQSPHVVARSDRMEPSSSLHLPHWLTSNNSDMDSSEVSVPRLKYPPWIQCCDVSEPAGASEAELWDRHAAASRLQAPSWVAELEDEEDPDGTISQVNGQQTLRNLRLQFAEQISLLAAERSSSSMKETLLRDNRMELLIQKADQVLNSLSRGCGAAERPPDPADTSTQPFTQDVPPPDTHPPLCFSSSHCQQDSSEVAAGGTTTPLEVRELQAQPHYSHHGNNLLKQPGPAEALKQVLFRLQAVEAELQHHQQPKASLSPSVDGPLQQEAEPEPRPDGLSLQRALHHLTHLKALVEEPRKEPGKNDKEEVEKDEDEGRYSSLSTDGFRCI